MPNVVLELLILALLNGTLAQSSIRPTVDVGYVTYLGNQTYTNTVAYLGIPYAEPPVGDLRFRATVPLNTTRVSEEANLNGEAVVNATYYPDFCIQGTTGGVCHFLPKILSDTVAQLGMQEEQDQRTAYTSTSIRPTVRKKATTVRFTIGVLSLFQLIYVVPVLFYIHGGGKSYFEGDYRTGPLCSISLRQVISMEIRVIGHLIPGSIKVRMSSSYLFITVLILSAS